MIKYFRLFCATVFVLSTHPGCADGEIGESPSTLSSEDAGTDSTERRARQKSNVWSLSMAQRRAYLTYYSPILMLRADESSNERGKSWITNFHFDGDDALSNNADNWSRTDDFIDGHADTRSWEIRPTLYTSLIEFMEIDGTKSVVLMYHVYHARDDRGIHDWERIEIRVDNVDGNPGEGDEEVRFVVATEHLDHIPHVPGDGKLNFQHTSNGQHAMIWQAQWSNPSTAGAHNQELRFVEDTFDVISARVANNSSSGANVTGADNRLNVHYVFVCDGATAAANYWGAQYIEQWNAGSLGSGHSWSDEVTWNQVVRVRYELQDIADIFPTHWENHEDIADSWKGSPVPLYLASPMLDEGGAVEVPAGLQNFLPDDVREDSPALDKDRQGYPDKSWLWGTYAWDGGDSSEVRSAMFNGTDSQPNRATASGLQASLGEWWWQHDYFAHDGIDTSPESGRWLPGSWYTPAAGGWDGRWEQLFHDEPWRPWWVVVLH